MIVHPLLKTLGVDLTTFKSLKPAQKKTLIQWLVRNPQQLNQITDVSVREKLEFEVILHDPKFIQSIILPTLYQWKVALSRSPELIKDFPLNQPEDYPFPSELLTESSFQYLIKHLPTFKQYQLIHYHPEVLSFLREQNIRFEDVFQFETRLIQESVKSCPTILNEIPHDINFRDYLWTVLLDFEFNHMDALGQYPNYCLIGDNEQRLSLSYLLVGTYILPEKIDQHLARLIRDDQVHSFSTSLKMNQKTQKNLDSLFHETLSFKSRLGTLSNQQKTYQLCRMFCRLNSHSQWFSPYHTLNLLSTLSF